LPPGGSVSLSGRLVGLASSLQHQPSTAMPPAQDQDREEKAVKIAVPSKDPKPQEGGTSEEQGKDLKQDKRKKGGKKEGNGEEEEELNEEDKALKEGLELAVTRSSDVEAGIQKVRKSMKPLRLPPFTC
jgi:hypothetical protein